MQEGTGWDMTAGQSQSGSFPSPAWAWSKWLLHHNYVPQIKVNNFPHKAATLPHLYYRENMDVTAGACQDTKAGLQS